MRIHFKQLIIVLLFLYVARPSRALPYFHCNGSTSYFPHPLTEARQISESLTFSINMTLRELSFPSSISSLFVQGICADFSWFSAEVFFQMKFSLCLPCCWHAPLMQSSVAIFSTTFLLAQFIFRLWGIFSTILLSYKTMDNT